MTDVPSSAELLKRLKEAADKVLNDPKEREAAKRNMRKLRAMGFFPKRRRGREQRRWH